MNTEEKIKALEEEIKNSKLSYYLISKTDKGIHLVYDLDLARIDEEKIFSMLEKYKDQFMTRMEIRDFSRGEALKYGLDLELLKDDQRKYIEESGMNIMSFLTKEDAQTDPHQ
jgi:hypothetical protein